MRVRLPTFVLYELNNWDKLKPLLSYFIMFKNHVPSWTLFSFLKWILYNNFPESSYVIPKVEK